MHDEPVLQPVFHKAESAKCALVLTKSRTWTVVISVSFTYFESFWLSVGDTVILHQSQVIGFKLFSESTLEGTQKVAFKTFMRVKAFFWPL
jgi:hypothetical protein